MLFVSSPAITQLDSCWKLCGPHDPENGFYNPDSLMVDTCVVPNRNYAKKWYEIITNQILMDVPSYPIDTLIEYQWTDIDTSFTDLREDFYDLENIFGAFHIKKEFPHIVDTSKIASRCYLIRFDNYVDIDSVELLLNSIEDIEKVWYQLKCGHDLSILLDEPGLQLGKLDESVGDMGVIWRNSYYYSDGNTSRSVSYHKLSCQWHIFQNKVPLAWEITKGNPSIIAGISGNKDNQDCQNSLPHITHGIGNTEDIYYDTHGSYNPQNSGSDGNVRCPLKLSGGNIIADQGDGSVYPTKLQIGHDFEALSVFNARDNNMGIVGVAPNCKAYPFAKSKDPSGIDVNISNTGKDNVNIVGYVTTGVDTDKVFSDINIENGLVFVAGVEVASSKEEFLSGNPFDDNCEVIWLKCIGTKLLKDGSRTPATNNIDKQCISWDPSIKENPSLDKLYIWSGDLILNNPNPTSTSIVFEDYTKKELSKYSTLEEYLRQKYQKDEGDLTLNIPPHPIMKDGIYSDILVPGVDIITADGDNNKYKIQDNHSFAVPQLTGTAALMLSIHDKLAVKNEQGQLEETSNELLHKKVYDIITFTADKIENSDVENFPYVRQILENGDAKELQIVAKWDENSYQVYSLQPVDKDILADKLDRYRSRLEVYGSLNTFRCVLHAIPAKGKYEYTSNDDFSESNEYYDLDGKKLIHFGSKIREGNWVDDPNFFDNEPDNEDPYKNPDINSDGDAIDELNVLEWGGRHFPSNTDKPWDNCHCETLINNAATITVAEDYILGIDGITRQTNSTKNNNKISTEETGKILITGYLGDVELNGTIKMDDLEVYSSTNDGFGRICIRDNTTNPEDYEASEIYGKVELNDFSYLKVESGKLIIQPGGSIHLNGSEDLVIEDDGILEMAYASSVFASDAQKIIVNSGGTLSIKSGAMCELNCIVDIQDGGAIVFEDLDGVTDESYYVKAKQIIYNSGADIDFNEHSIIVPIHPSELGSGKILVKNGATLTIDNSADNTYPIALIGGVTVEEGASFVVDEDSYLDLGYIDVKSGGNFTVDSETEITLFAKENNLNGNITLGNSSTPKAKIYGYCEDDHPYSYSCDSDGLIFSKMIMKNGTDQDGDPSDNTLSMENVEFKYVRIVEVNMHISKIENCDFYTDAQTRKDYNHIGNLPMLEMIFKNHWIDEYMDKHSIGSTWGNNLVDVDISKCNFYDDTDVVFDYNIPTNTPTDDAYYEEYRMIGLRIENLRIVEIEGESYSIKSLFSDLYKGIDTDNCSMIDIKFCDFANSHTGNIDKNSSVMLCQNSFTETQIGTSLEGSKSRTIYDNVYNKNEQAVKIISSASQSLRGNFFQDIYKGICSGSSTVRLAPPYYASYSSTKNYGRNEFTTENILENSNNIFGLLDSKVNPDENSTIMDIMAMDNDAYFVLLCGLNKFSNKSSYHIGSFYGDIDNDGDERWANISAKPINCKKNEWLDEYNNISVRKQIPWVATIETPPLNESSDEDGCSENYTLVCYNELTNSPEKCGLSISSLIPDVELHYPSILHIYSDTAFYSSRYYMQDTSVNVECRKEKYFDAIQAAIIGDSSIYKLNLLLADYSIIVNDTSLPDINRKIGMMLKGECFERLENLDSAKSCYESIITNFSSSLDSMKANWSIRKINSFLLDSTYGGVYDSCMAVYHSVDVEDLKLYKGGGGQQKPPIFNIEGNNTEYRNSDYLEQNIPNPFSDKTTIKFYLADNRTVRLSISNIL
jgi:hypothetical protein